MKNLYYIVLALVFAVGVAACGGGASVKDAPVDEQSTSSAETGTADSGSATGESISEESTQMVAMAGERPTVMRVHFEFDSSAIDSESQALIEAHAAYLADNPDVLLGLEGHADERGSREYNIGLGERRSQAVRQLLLIQGVRTSQVSTVSFGEERPVARGSSESDYAQNRRVEITYTN